MKRTIRLSIVALVLIAAAYGLGRLYFVLTDGFREGNIVNDLAYDPRWEITPLSQKSQQHVDDALDQEFFYLGKGCQSYVFVSNDGQYVLKFFKYQRFRTQPWLEPFRFIPLIDEYQQRKAKEKKAKLDNVFQSWKNGYEYFQKQTGVVFAHFNKHLLNRKNITIRDKLGFKHKIALEKTEFLLQRRAEMLCSTIDRMMSVKAQERAQTLIDRLLVMLLLEYVNGFADNDHALMQNTGVLDGYPVHIDVGQLIYNEVVKDPTVYHQQIYDKTYRFCQWLDKHHPALADHLRNRLFAIIEVDYFFMPPYTYKGDVGKIPHQQPPQKLSVFLD